MTSQRCTCCCVSAPNAYLAPALAEQLHRNYCAAILNTGGSGSLSVIKPRLLLPRADDHAPPTVSRPLSAAAAGDAVPAGARRRVKKKKKNATQRITPARLIAMTTACCSSAATRTGPARLQPLTAMLKARFSSLFAHWISVIKEPAGAARLPRPPACTSLTARGNLCSLLKQCSTSV